MAFICILPSAHHVPVCAGGVRDGAGEAAADLQAGPRQEGG